MKKSFPCAQFVDKQSAYAESTKHGQRSAVAVPNNLPHIHPHRQADRLNLSYPTMQFATDVHSTGSDSGDSVDGNFDNNANDFVSTEDHDPWLSTDAVPEMDDAKNADAYVSFTTEQMSMIKLIRLLDSFNAPDYAVEEVLQWAEEAYSAGFNFRPKCKSRNANIKWMYGMIENAEHFLPVLRPVHPTKGEPFEVICYDFVPQLLSILQDPKLMSPNNLCMDPNNPCAMYYPSDGWLGECHSGSVYRELYTRHIHDESRELLCSIIAYVDKTNMGAGSRFSLEPFLFTTSLFTEEARRSHKHWRAFGYVHDCVSSTAFKKSTLEPGDSIRIYHQQLKVLLETYATSTTRLKNVILPIGPQREMMVDIICPLMYIICDNEEAEKLAGHYNSRTSGVRKHSRCCNVSFDDLDNPDHVCIFDAWDDIDAISLFGTDDDRRLMSVHEVENAFKQLTLSDVVRGILGILLPDTLHVYNKGPIERVMHVLFENVSDNKKVKMDEVVFHFHKTHNQTARKFFPSTDFSRGISQLTKLTSNENVGAIFLLVIVSHYKEGWQILQEALNSHEETGNVKDVIELMEAMLCFHAWLKQERLWPLDHEDEYSGYAEGSIRQLVHMITSKLPRAKGNQWKIIKLHYMLHYINEAKRFGSPRGWDAERPENFHIHFAKRIGRRAHKCRETFERSTAQRLADGFIIDTLYDRLCCPEQYESDDASMASDSDPVPVACGTKCTITHQTGTSHYNALWQTRSDATMMQLPRGLAKFVCKQLNRSCVVLRTELKYGDVTARCHPWYQNSAPRYDWVRVLHSRNQKRPCKLVGVISNKENDIP